MTADSKRKIDEAVQAREDNEIDSNELRKRVNEALGSARESKAQEYVRLMKEREEKNRWKT